MCVFAACKNNEFDETKSVKKDTIEDGKQIIQEIKQISQEPEEIKPDFGKIALDEHSRMVCNTNHKTISRNENALESLIKSILKNAENPSLCAESIAYIISSYFNKLSAHLISLKEKTLEYDIAIIGAGPQAAILANNLKDTNLKIVTIEKEATFARHFRSTICNLNFPETMNYKGHYFPGAFTQLSDIMKNITLDEQYPLAQELWSQIAFTLFYSNTEYLNEKLVSIDHLIHENKAKETSYNLVFDSGRHIHAKSVVFASGLGNPTININNATSVVNLIQNFKMSHKEQLPPVFFIDDLIDWTEHNRINNRDSFNSFSNKDIAVIGSGNGGLVLVNYLTGKSPEREYKNKQAISFPKNIY